jgi:hypothetical protein
MKKISQHDFQFFKNLMIFFSKIKSDQMFPLHIIFHICAKIQTKTRRNVHLNVFNHIVTF